MVNYFMYRDRRFVDKIPDGLGVISLFIYDCRWVFGGKRCA